MNYHNLPVHRATKINEKPRLVKLVPTIALLIFIFCYKARSQSTVNQAPESVRDSVYIVILLQELPNGRPVQNYLTLKNTDVLANTSMQDISKADFLCRLFGQCVLFEDAYFTLTKNVNFLSFKNEWDKVDYLESESRRIKQLNKSFGKNMAIRFRDGMINIRLAKLYGEFWIIKGALTELSCYSDSYNIPARCYNKDYKYNLKHIIKFLPFN